MKKFLSLMIALVFCLALLPMTALADDPYDLKVIGGDGGAAGAGGDGGYVQDGDATTFWAAGGGGGAGGNTNNGEPGEVGEFGSGGAGGSGETGSGSGIGGVGAAGVAIENGPAPDVPVTEPEGPKGGTGGGFNEVDFEGRTFTALGGVGAATHETNGGNGGEASLEVISGNYDSITVTGGAGGDGTALGGEATLDATGNLTVDGEGLVTVAGGTVAGGGAAILRAESLTTGSGNLAVTSTDGAATVDVTDSLTAKGDIVLTKGDAALNFSVGSLVVDGAVGLTIGAGSTVTIDDELLLRSGSFGITGTYTTAVNLTVEGKTELNYAVTLTEKDLIFRIPNDGTIKNNGPIAEFEEVALLTLGAAIAIDASTAEIMLEVGNSTTLAEGDVITLLKIPNGSSFNMGGDFNLVPGTFPSDPENPLNEEGPVESENSDHEFDLYYVDDGESSPVGYLLAVVTYAPEPGSPGRSSSGGCDAGAFGLFALLAIPLLSMKKKEK